ncbi:chromatin remodelling complex rsc7/Swp82 subunit [Hirsutella rhossiliensis]
MYSAQPGGADSATINPAALNSPALSDAPPRGHKRSRSSDSHDAPLPTGDDVRFPPQRKRARPMKPSEAPGQAPGPAGPSAAQPPHTPQSQSTSLPSQATPAYAPAAAAPPKTTPTKSTLKALPTVRDHTTDQLNPSGDEYLPREMDEFGEKKVMQNGQLLGNRTYRCRTFLVPNRGDKLFMLATECARVLGYRDSYLLFNKNRSLYKIIASQAEKDDLVQQEILPFSYRSRQIAIVTARSMFRQFGSRVIENGRRVRDDYWETKARKQGFTEADPAGEKRPGAAKAREAAEAAQNNVLMSGPHTEIVYNNNPGPYPGASQPHLVQAEFNDTRPRDFSGIIKGGPRQEITGPPYQDQTRPTPLTELHTQAHHAADFNRSVNQQRDMRSEYIQSIWRRPHEQPPSSSMSQQPVSSSDNSNNANVPTSRPSSSPHTTASGVPQQPVVTSQSPQMMMTTAPYSQSMHAPNTLGQAPMRSSSGSISQGTPGYNYQSNQAMWSQSPQPSHHTYASYTTQSQSPHPSQSPAPHLRQPSTAGQMQPNMPFPTMSGMQYGAGQGIYPAEQTPRQYLPQNAPGGPTVSQPWSGQQHSPPPQWWAPPQQPQ